MKIANSFEGADLALCRPHSAMVAAPKRVPAAPVERRRAPVHAMCLAMSEVYQWAGPALHVQRFGRALRSDSRSHSHIIDHDHRIATGPTIEELVKSGRLGAPSEIAPSTELRHLVCVTPAFNANVGAISTAYESTSKALRVREGLIASGGDWRLCDAAGWIPHVPTADSVCPVPGDVEFDILICNGEYGPGGRGDCNMIKWDTGTSVVGWRPAAVAELRGMSRASS